MASYRGFLVYDDAGRAQVVDDAYDITLERTVNVNGSANIREPIIALQPTATSPIFFQYIFRGDHMTPSEMEKQEVRGVGKAHVFDFNNNVVSTYFGLEVYDANGKPTFSTATRSIDIIDVISISDWRDAQQSNGGNIVFRKRYHTDKVAVIPSSVPFEMMNLSNNSSSYALGSTGYSMENGYLTVRKVSTDDNFFPKFSGVYYFVQYEFFALVIDVSNF